jgi:hypothetical protein
MPTILATYFAWADFNGGRPSTLEEFRNYLSRYSRSEVVYLCCVLNHLLNSWEGPKLRFDTHAELLAIAFPPELASRLVEGSKDHQNRRLVFHRVQLLFVAKEALLSCTESGIDPLTAPYWGRFGAAFLMANDHLHFDAPEGMQEGEITESLPNFVLLQEYSGHNRFPHRVVRAHLMYTRFPEQLKEHSDYLDMAAEFGKCGLSLTEFESLCFAALTKYLNLDFERFNSNSAHFLLADSYFQTTAIGADKIALFFREIAASADALLSAFKERNAGPIDFTALRDKPLYRHESSTHPFDPAFLAEKLETGPFWNVLRALPTNEKKQRLHRFWGVLFQEYLNWLLSSSVDQANNVYVPSPRYAETRQEVCDGAVLCGAKALLLEYKGTTFTAQAKYSGDAARLMNELENKLMRPKGVTQLAAAVNRLFDKRSPGAVDTIDTSKIRTIFPVLVTRDDITGAFLMNYLLNKKFKQMVNRKRLLGSVTIAPLFCLTADEVEYISPYLKDTPFSAILEAKYSVDRDLKMPFHLSENDVLTRRGERRSEVLYREYREISNRIKNELFPGAPDLPSLDLNVPSPTSKTSPASN